MEEIGYTGLNEYRGQISEEFLRELRFGPGQKGYAKYNEMRNNAPVIGALIAAIRQTVQSMSWMAESDLGEDDPRKELLDYAMKELAYPLKNHIGEALSAVVFGWSYFETVWKRDGSRVLWDYFAMRGQDTLERWELGPRGELLGMWQCGTSTANYKSVMIPIEKAIHYAIDQEKRNPEGRSILRTAYTSYYFWKNISTIEAIGVERDVAGLPKITLPPGADTTTNANSDKSKAEKIVRNVRNDEQAGLVIPDGWGFELLSSAGSKQFDTDRIITRYENRMLMSALAQFLMLGSDGVGSLALSTNQTDFFVMSVNALADLLAEALTCYAVKPLMEYNGYDPNGIKIDHSPAGSADLASVGAFLQQTSTLLTWTAQDELWLRQLAQMPDIDPETIDAERMAKEEQAARMAENLRRAQQAQQPPDMNEDDGEDMIDESDEPYTAFAAIRSHTDPDKRLWEDRYRRIMEAFYRGQKKRVIAGARGIKNG